MTYRPFVHGEPDGGFAELTFCVVRSDTQVSPARRPALWPPLSRARLFFPLPRSACLCALFTASVRA